MTSVAHRRGSSRAFHAIAFGMIVSLLSPATWADEPGVPLFNGTSLDGWEGKPEFWRAENGVIVGETYPTGEGAELIERKVKEAEAARPK